jgi:hypothetical protein
MKPPAKGRKVTIRSLSKKAARQQAPFSFITLFIFSGEGL